MFLKLQEAAVVDSKRQEQVIERTDLMCKLLKENLCFYVFAWKFGFKTSKDVRLRLSNFSGTVLNVPNIELIKYVNVEL